MSALWGRVGDDAAARYSSRVLALETIACPLCGEESSTTLYEQRDFALGVPGRYALVRCPRCSLLYQNPRIRMDQLELAYPANYPPHAKDPEISRAARRLDAAGRRVLAQRLGYRHLDPGALPLGARLKGAVHGRRIAKAFVPWVGQGRLLDVGCAMGRFLRLMASVGWSVSGIEIDPEAAAHARKVTPHIFHGDPMDAPFAPGSFDLVTAFHVLEHLPDPVAVLKRMLGWLAPGGIAVVEVPNVSGVGGRVFGRYWSGLEMPRHLVQFTPETMGALAERAGGRVVAATHKSKPRYLIRSLRNLLDDHDGRGAQVARTLVDSRLGGGVLKLLLELTLPVARPLRMGEAVRYVIEPTR